MSERIMGTGFGEALCAEPLLIGASSGETTSAPQPTWERHQ